MPLFDWHKLMYLIQFACSWGLHCRFIDLIQERHVWLFSLIWCLWFPHIYRRHTNLILWLFPLRIWSNTNLWPCDLCDGHRNMLGAELIVSHHTPFINQFRLWPCLVHFIGPWSICLSTCNYSYRWSICCILTSLFNPFVWYLFPWLW
jgi:hypothetical protein